ncbi:guanine nucleotide-binding protein subunit beta 1, partial [Ascosphaera pollenicola]
IIAISANAAQNDPTIIGPNSLTRQLVSHDCVQTLITSMLKGGNPLTVGVGIVIEVIRKNNSDYDAEFVEGPNSMPSVNDPIYLGSLLRLFARHVPEFMQLILSDTTATNHSGRYEIVPRKQLHTAANTGTEALGFDRFKTCELMAELLHCSNMGLLNEVGSEEYIRRRDAERRKLVHDGVVGVWRESGAEMDGDGDVSGIGTQGDSVYMYGDNSSTQFLGGGGGAGGGSQTPSSVLGLSASASSERIDRSDLSLGSNPEAEVDVVDGVVTPLESDREDEDDDGFEDVSIMRDELERNKKTGYGPGGAETEADQGMSGLVDEPLTPPKNSKLHPTLSCKSSHSQPPEASDHPRSVSPTDEITSRLESLSIEQGDEKEEKKSVLENEVPTSTTPPETPVPVSAVPAAVSTTPPMIPSALPLPKTPEQEREDKERELDRVDLSKYNDALIQIDVDGQPVIGDYLKIMFVENQVVPTILSFFFRFPWNNFLHNVVFDVIQQVLSGSMDRGFNRSLAIDVFVSGNITQNIVTGQQRSDIDQKTRGMRLGYMGHLTLIAEEVIKFSERHAPETLGAEIMEKVIDAEWIFYVENTLSDTRERDNAILGGVRPDLTLGNSVSWAALSSLLEI